MDQFFKRNTPIWRFFENCVLKLSLLGLIEKRFTDKNSAVILKDKFETVEITEDSSILKLVFLADFSLDFSKCPVTVGLFVGSLEELSVVLNAVRDEHMKFSKELTLKNSFKKALLIDLSSLAMHKECLENWQQLWSIKTLLEPTSYSHDLVNLFLRNNILV
jgi:hypothetical protein